MITECLRNNTHQTDVFNHLSIFRRGFSGKIFYTNNPIHRELCLATATVNIKWTFKKTEGVALCLS